MEKGFGKKETKKAAAEAGERPLSLVEQQRQEAFAAVLSTLERRFPVELKNTFISHEKEYSLTSQEDCMVAFAQQHREAVEALYQDIILTDDYRQEQAVAKLLKLFEAYERMVVLYAELRSYYPRAAAAIEEKLPPLEAVRTHAAASWDKLTT